MKAPNLIAELLDFGFSQVFFVLGLGELFADIFKVAQDTFQDFAHAFHFRADFMENRAVRGVGAMRGVAAWRIGSGLAWVGSMAVLLKASAVM